MPETGAAALSTAATATARKTAYVVLKASSSTDSPPGALWKPVGTVEATSAAAAIKTVAKQEPGTYVAVPASSWKPATVKIETKQIVTLAEAT